MLFRNVFRTLKKKWLQLFLLGLIMVMSSFIYTMMSYSIDTLLEPTEEYFDQANQEDFAIGLADGLFEDDLAVIQSNCPQVLQNHPDVYTVSGLYDIDRTCYKSVMTHRIEAIESIYEDITLELREYKDIYFTFNNRSVRMRVLKENDMINTTYVIEGGLPQNDRHITITEIFAKKHNLSIGDTLTINEKDYEITAFTLFPDYSLTILSETLIIDNTSQTIGTVTDSEFTRINSDIGFDIAGTTSLTDEAFTDTVIDTIYDQGLPYITSATLTINNMRSGAIYSELSGGRAMNIFLSLMIASIGLIIVGIMISKVLSQQRGPIGILKAMGYTNTEITLPYILFIAILALPTIILGYFIGWYFAEPFKNIYLEFYLLPYQAIEQDISTVFVAIIVPYLFLLLISFVIIQKMLKKDPVTLLNPVVTSQTNKLVTKLSVLLKPFNIKTKLKHLLLYRSMVKFLVFLIGIFFAAFTILFSFSMTGMMDRMIYDYYENTHHETIGYCDYQSSCPVSDDDEKVIELSSVLVNESNVMLIGLDQSSDIHPLYNDSGEIITEKISDGLVITSSMHLIENIDIGDEVSVQVGSDSTTLNVVGITEEYGASKAYYSRSSLSAFLMDNTTYYNAVYSQTNLNEDNYLHVISTNDILKQAEEMQAFFNMFIMIMISVSIVLGTIIIYILTLLTIEDNFYNISLFKVMGYNNKEIDKMILGGYLTYGVIIFLITIPIAFAGFQFMEQFFADFYGLLFPVSFKLWHAVLGLGIYLVIFYLGALNAKHHLNDVALQEAMKMYQV
ncbi:MAG: ABC transporter permease [Candidatus Izemoplasma sp.]|nr:ABC transporter permease [Candidatus Izemoplasma sp.]